MRIDPKAKSWPEVTRRVKGHHPSADELLPSYRREVARARQFLVDKDVVPFPPGDDCQVVETPPFLRSTTTASYEPAPALDPETRGLFFVTPVDPIGDAASRRRRCCARTITAIRSTRLCTRPTPGTTCSFLSHAAIRRSSARWSMPSARPSSGPTSSPRDGGSTRGALMGELGYYTDEERLMVLEWTLVRAARVIIDVGLHTRGMSFDEAVKILDGPSAPRARARGQRSQTLHDVAHAAALVPHRPRADPRDASRFQQKAGGDHSLKAFHAAVLSHGTIAPGLVEREMFVAHRFRRPDATTRSRALARRALSRLLPSAGLHSISFARLA